MSSVICTVLNEESTIGKLLSALGAQTKLPKEVVIVDGGSSDGTWEVLLQTQQEKKLPFVLKIAQEKGNRSVGRNAAIKLASSEMIAITDAGCEPEPQWLQELENVYEEGTVVAGAAEAAPALTPLQSAMVPYVLVMPDKVNQDTFLPATRSMLISKALWKELNGFDESLSDNEDYAFAKKLETLKNQKKIKIVYASNAVVKWQPRQTLSQFSTMIFRFARGDAFAGILRPKVLFIFFRYFAMALLFLFSLMMQSRVGIDTVMALFVLYLGWSIYKNAKYVPLPSLFWLPILQLVSDCAVMIGTVQGLYTRTST